MFNNIDNEIRKTEQELKHVGSCTTKGLTQEQIAQLDERFFLAIEKLTWLKGRNEMGYRNKIYETLYILRF